MSASNDGSESVDQFLARISSLSRKNDEEEAERNRRMEEEMMQARKERRARREERARSISPVKTGPAVVMSSPRTVLAPPERALDPPITFTPSSQTQTPTRRERSQSPVAPAPLRLSPIESSRPLPPPPVEKPATPTFPAANASSLSRSGTLSWQQRPVSRDGASVRSRPLSVVRGAFREPVERQEDSPSEEDKQEPSRADIAASLAARDPSWFRQTADRGLGSAAYRKNNDQSIGSDLHASRGMRLPGMAGQEDKAHAQPDTSLQETVGGEIPTTTTVESRPMEELSGRRQLAPVSSLQPSSDGPSSSPDPRPLQEDTGSLSRSQNTLSSAGRPPSPTKGLGGFVQSAMMRRSDSVSKRWSVQANTGLKRGDSVAGSRPTFNPSSATPSLAQPRTLSRDPRPIRDGTSSPLSNSRPTSSSGPERSLPTEQKELEARGLPVSKSPDLTEQEPPSTPPSESMLSRSPSKTLDPRRWSPTKASWLESALSKPESPRPTAGKPEPPAWKIGLERSRSQRNVDRSPTRPSSFEPVSTGGLLRSPPPGSPTKASASLADSASFAAKQTSQTSDEPSKGDLSEKMEASELSKDITPARSTVKDTAEPPVPDETPSRDESFDTQKANFSISNARQSTPQEGKDKPDIKASSDKKPPALKPKPQTPPKTDFRSTLRSRQADSSGPGEKEPEFKAVFGKLKHTQTQNYVAPDVLKNNITRGKAALNVTGGPQKTKRVDEFKESILQRKEDMKAGGGSIHKRQDSKPGQDESPEKKDAAIPEALARRKTLHKPKASTDTTSEKPILAAPTRSVGPKPAVIASSKADSAVTKPTPSKPAPKVDSSRLLDVRKADAEAITIAESTHTVSGSIAAVSLPKASFEKPVEKASFLPPSEPISRTTSASPDKELSKTASNKLAARLNPALAGLIARGNSPRPTNESTHSGASIEVRTLQPGASTTEGNDGSTGLTHMTKARAKGPKRRAPKAEPVPMQKTPTASATVSQQAPHPTKSASSGSEKGSAPLACQSFEADQETSKTNPTASLKPSIGQKPALGFLNPTSNPATTSSTNVDGAADAMKEKPRVATKSPELRKVSDKTKVVVEEAEVSPPKALQSKPFNIVADKKSQDSRPSTPRRTESPVRSSAISMPLTPSKSKVNSPKMPNPAVDSPILKATPKTGLGLNFTPGAKQKAVAPELTPPPEKEIKANSNGDGKVDEALVKFFGTVPRSADKLDFDSEAFLKAQSEHVERVKTLSNKIVEVTGDGKQSPMPPSQEHILYEDSMYLCVHSFDMNNAKTTEVYLWAGDGVAEAAIEDAQIFCKKVARENSSKLEVVKQGKESARFFSALGGILIIRKSKSSALYMLCGRRHGGHVVFDEVEFSPASLCSGFSFLISAKFGKLYLWIGAGSCADEYGAARLIGTDLGLTGEIEEVSEGNEPASFWESFSTPTAKKQAKSSDTWSMRSGSDHKGFPCRLYRVEQERPKSSGGFWGLRASSPPKSSNKASLQEVSPFSQQDLNGGCVHLLDAYATIYVIPGNPSPSKSVDFVSALHIAQELAVLTPSMQDRALLPSCQILFGEPPHDFRAAFRKWTPGSKADAGHRSECFDAAEVMRVLG